MITVLSITSIVLLSAAVYFAVGKSKSDTKLQDYVAKYKSVQNYAETLTQATTKQTEPVKTVKAKTNVSQKAVVAGNKKNVMPEAPTRRGRKPKAI